VEAEKLARALKSFISGNLGGPNKASNGFSFIISGEIGIVLTTPSSCSRLHARRSSQQAIKTSNMATMNAMTTGITSPIL
jgi:hypothetical protein